MPPWATGSRLAMLGGMKGYLRSVGALASCLILAACGTQRAVVVQHSTAGGVSRTAPPAAINARGETHDGVYRVAKGDTLYSIAFRHGADFRDLARWNGIAAPYTIWPGQELVLHAPSARPSPSPALAAKAGQTRIPAPPAAPRPVPAPLPAATASSVSSDVPVAGVPAPVAPPPPPAPPATMPVPAGGTRSAGGVAWRWPADGKVIKGFRSGDAIPGIEIAGPAGSAVRAAADGVVVYSGNGLVGYGELVIVKHSDDFLSAYGHNRKRLVKEGQRVTAGQQIAEMGSTGASRDELQFQIRRSGNPVDPLDYLPAR